jgi:hypothetical protein
MKQVQHTNQFYRTWQVMPVAAVDCIMANYIGGDSVGVLNVS